jgi:DNA processing protein
VRLLQPRRLEADDLPACLRDLSRPPAGLWYLGRPEALKSASERAVAIVGTRDASSYGERTAKRLATAAVRAGLTVISGLARGVDAAAHRAALEAGGTTIAVQGPGVDVPYPVGHRTLHGEIADRGLVLSESEPGATAFPGCFPRRNRIIAGLAKVTVVVEAGFKSGAMNTASHALAIGRVVGAVPGPIDEPRSAGSNLLIRDGAHVLTSVDDMLNFYGLSTNAVSDDRPEVTAIERQILGLLAGDGIAGQDLAFALGVPLGHVAQELARLEIAGVAENVGGVYRRRVG